ncbi:hypothetical protein LRD18_09485 [Halorhodospira halochloris]|uniref:hypothetical protein n=1 Tax=Halorhodospira halochloris TaxID=1052 RepID=UPI001EE8A5FB|nr:hypothetical protein [Halorhodospira halochloris]MCG5531102.1 hypothetical protein [Halorhodospira halochloris]
MNLLIAERMRCRTNSPLCLLAAFALCIVALTGCSEPDVDGLAQEYCDYFENATDMDFEQKQETITALDRRLIEKNVRQGRMRTALRQTCPDVIARSDVEMMGIMGQDLLEMQEQLRELR